MNLVNEAIDLCDRLMWLGADAAIVRRAIARLQRRYAAWRRCGRCGLRAAYWQHVTRQELRRTKRRYATWRVARSRRINWYIIRGRSRI